MQLDRSGVLAFLLSLVAVVGCETSGPSTAANGAGTAVEIPPELVAGRDIYRNTCMLCHDRGDGGAPRIDSAVAWRARLEQPEDVLVLHATEGFRGERGTMPPRGDKPDLTDDEVRQAVQYMMFRVQSLPPAP